MLDPRPVIVLRSLVSRSLPVISNHSSPEACRAYAVARQCLESRVRPPERAPPKLTDLAMPAVRNATTKSIRAATLPRTLRALTATTRATATPSLPGSTEATRIVMRDIAFRERMLARAVVGRIGLVGLAPR
jgi:hypothetical protein